MRKTSRSMFVLLILLGLLTRVDTQEPGRERALPRLSAWMQTYYEQHPEEFQKFVESQPFVSNELWAGQQLPAGQEPIAGTWTSLNNPLGINLSNPILMTDGTIIAHRSGTPNWYKFTPDINGSYVNGTWAAIASTVAGYGPRFFGSGVLPDGRVIIEGGEYNNGGGRTTQGAIYNPLSNTWTPVAPPAGWSTISDAGGVVLPSGTYLQTSCCDNPPHAALFNPATLGWTATGAGKFDVYDEESMALLHDGTVLTADAYVFTGTCGTNSERYTPATGMWTTAGSTIVQQSDCTGKFSFEIGPIVMRPDGTAVSFSGRTSGAPQTAIFNNATNTWAAGPVHPSFGGVPYTMADAPAAMLPNGNILVAMSPSNWAASNSFPAPTHFWELNANNTWTIAPDKVDAAAFNSYQQNFILLPTGQVMSFSIDGPTVQIYTPDPGFNNAWRPVITSTPTTLSPSQTFTVGGTQLNGLTEGTYYGDDTNASTNFPIVRVRNNATGHVFYARTFNHSTRSIAPGAASTTSVALPAGLELGASTLVVVANGIPSAAMNVTVAAPTAAVITSPPPGTVIGGTVNFRWSTGSGASQYWLYVGSTGVGSANIYNASQGLALSHTVTGVPTSGTIYVRLWTLLPGGWTFHDYTYPGATPTAAVITSPTPGSTLAGTSTTFVWNTGTGAIQYYLYVGTTGVGSSNIYSASQGTALSHLVTGLPTSGTIYVRLWTLLASGWTFNDYTYTGSPGTPADITTPPPTTTLAGTQATFAWTAGVGASQYWLYVGTTGVGSSNIYTASQGTSLSHLVTGLPTSGTIYVRLWTLLANGWNFRDYTYTGGVARAAVLTTPTPGTTLPGATTTFGWTSGNGVSAYWLYVGNTGAGSSNIYSASQGTALSKSVPGIPLSGTINVRLWSLLSTGWVFTDYTYTGGAASSITTPPPNASLSGTTDTFNWSTVSGAGQYWLYVGNTGVGSFNIYNASQGTALSHTVTGLPTSGTVNVRIWTFTSSWAFNDFTYTAGGAAAMTSPAAGAILSSTTTTFNWNTGTGADQYWLYVGTTGVGSFDIYNASQATNVSQVVSGLPSNGTIYVRLWTHSASGWAWNDYMYDGRGAADLKFPVPGSTLSGTTVTFDWDAGNGATQYWLYVGTTGVGSSNIFSASTGTNQFGTVTGMPTSGTVNVRLWTLLPTGWTSNDYTFTGGPEAAATPAGGVPTGNTAQPAAPAVAGPSPR